MPTLVMRKDWLLILLWPPYYGAKMDTQIQDENEGEVKKEDKQLNKSNQFKWIVPNKQHQIPKT